MLVCAKRQGVMWRPTQLTNQLRSYISVSRKTVDEKITRLSEAAGCRSRRIRRVCCRLGLDEIATVAFCLRCPHLVHGPPRSPICSPICNPIRSPIHGPIRGHPVRGLVVHHCDGRPLGYVRVVVQKDGYNLHRSLPDAYRSEECGGLREWRETEQETVGRWCEDGVGMGCEGRGGESQWGAAVRFGTTPRGQRWEAEGG